MNHAVGPDKKCLCADEFGMVVSDFAEVDCPNCLVSVDRALEAGEVGHSTPRQREAPMRRLRTLRLDSLARKQVGIAAGQAQSGDQMDYGLLCYERGRLQGILEGAETLFRATYETVELGQQRCRVCDARNYDFPSGHAPECPIDAALEEVMRTTAALVQSPAKRRVK